MCEYCENNEELVGDWAAGASVYVSVRIADGTLCLNEFSDWDESERSAPEPYGGTEISFCPMCGKQLRETA